MLAALEALVLLGTGGLATYATLSKFYVLRARPKSEHFTLVVEHHKSHVVTISFYDGQGSEDESKLLHQMRLGVRAALGIADTIQRSMDKS